MRWSFGSGVCGLLAVCLLACLPRLYQYSFDLAWVTPGAFHLYVVFCLAFAALLAGLVLWTLQPDRWAAGRRSVSAVVSTLFVLGVIEMVFHRLVPADVFHRGLIFPPHSEAHYDTLEFSFDAHVNNIGIRDRDVGLLRNGKAFTGGAWIRDSGIRVPRYRILAVGDSTTYGWGVDIDKAWPKVLERNLRAHGLDVEVDNLGQPGTGPPQYADLVEKAVPLLKPDLIVVGVLQGDDLHQSTRPNPVHTSLEHLTSRPLEELFPDLLVSITNRTIMKAQKTDVAWRGEIKRLTGTLDDTQRHHLETIEPAIRQAWTAGRLNPGSFVLGVIYPDYFASTVDVESSFTQMQIRNMTQHLQRIRRVAEAYDAQVLVLSVPWGIYMSDYDQRNFARLGFQIDPRMVTTDTADRAIAAACRSAALPFRSATSQLRRASQNAHLFYPLDCHLTAQGNETFASYVTPIVEQPLRAIGH